MEASNLGGIVVTFGTHTSKAAGRPLPCIYMQQQPAGFAPLPPVGGQGTPTTAGRPDELNPGRRGPQRATPGLLIRARYSMYISPQECGISPLGLACGVLAVAGVEAAFGPLNAGKLGQFDNFFINFVGLSLFQTLLIGWERSSRSHACCDPCKGVALAAGLDPFGGS